MQRTFNVILASTYHLPITLSASNNANIFKHGQTLPLRVELSLVENQRQWVDTDTTFED